MVQGPNILKVDVVQVRKSEAIIGSSAHIFDTAVVNANSLRRDLWRRTQRNTDTSSLSQYVWQCEVLLEICKENENNDDDNRLNTVFWHVQTSSSSVFMMFDLPSHAVYKIITPTLEYWYMECSSIIFVGVQPRPLGIAPVSRTHNGDSMRPYYHSVAGCAANDLPCSVWRSCIRPCVRGSQQSTHDNSVDDNDDEVCGGSMKYEQLRSSHRMVMKGFVPTMRPTSTPIGSP